MILYYRHLQAEDFQRCNLGVSQSLLLIQVTFGSIASPSSLFTVQPAGSRKLLQSSELLYSVAPPRWIASHDTPKSEMQEPASSSQ